MENETRAIQSEIQWDGRPKSEWPIVCQWWALCQNKATLMRKHPILVEVPICDRCNKKVEELS